MSRLIVTLLLLAALRPAAAQIDPATGLPIILTPSPSTGTPTMTAPAAPAPAPAYPPVFPSSQPPPATGAPAPSTAAPQPTPSTAAPQPILGARGFDYSVNLQSDVFGANMFTGAFAASTASIFNPDHVIAIGDQLQVRLWGAFQYDTLATVDPQGNIFVPQVGPVGVLGVSNKDLQRVLEESLRRTFRSSVYSYISLAAAQPVRVFVTGFVYRPGMYQGTSTDSVLRYLDQAGGIDPGRGSFLDVQVRRGSQLRGRFNLYDFLLTGVFPGVQLADGDVIVVEARKSMFKVAGLAENAKRFEFAAPGIALSDLTALAKPLPSATHVRVVRNTGIVRNTEYYPLDEAARIKLQNGDDVEFTADKRPGTITVRVQGEHVSAQEYVLPYGTRMAELIKRVQFTERSDADNLQLFRESVKARQRALLDATLKTFESSVLTARSGTEEEAKLRTEEAALMLQWVERARKVEPLGQVVMAQAKERDNLLLENGDMVQVPVKDGLVLLHGEVLFPNAVAYDASYNIEDYIQRAGGYSVNADTSRILVAHRDGSFEQNPAGARIRPGDDLLVLPKVDTKARQFFKDLTQIIFQIALTAKVVFGL